MNNRTINFIVTSRGDTPMSTRTEHIEATWISINSDGSLQLARVDGFLALRKHWISVDVAPWRTPEEIAKDTADINGLTGLSGVNFGSGVRGAA